MLHHSDRLIANGKTRLDWGQYKLLTKADAGRKLFPGRSLLNKKANAFRGLAANVMGPSNRSSCLY